MTFNMGRWLKSLPLNPLACRLRLLEAVEQGAITFPKGLASGSLLPRVIRAMHLHDATTPEQQLLKERYGHLADLEPAGRGFPLDGILELLDRMTAGEHPQFCSAVVSTLGDLLIWDKADGLDHPGDDFYEPDWEITDGSDA